MNNRSKALAGGVIGGGFGTVVLIAVAGLSGHDAGWAALPIGVCTGIGLMIGTGGKGGTGFGVLAACLAVLCTVGGRLVVAPTCACPHNREAMTIKLGAAHDGPLSEARTVGSNRGVATALYLDPGFTRFLWLFLAAASAYRLGSVRLELGANTRGESEASTIAPPPRPGERLESTKGGAAGEAGGTAGGTDRRAA